ncbi:hypothetical protein [Streptomyces sp. UNOC14_S4]|uniref:hypothetical protein n=1 Tax=Streptomyces sp. UNOC14_S4 TaxID=2872340 RepID=UPI001E341DD3|nr:hypothetical protein [Streptomyces sp. UNOC14_S4]MCC3766055.1 hypothetical protein [Streptomyces sp. UNOC14_S4]
MRLTRESILEDVRNYLRVHVEELGVLKPLHDALKEHRHDGDAACDSRCPLIAVSPVVLDERDSVLHFFHVPTRSWVLYADFVEPSTESLAHSAYQILVETLGMDSVWLPPQPQPPLLIDVSTVPGDRNRCIPPRTCYTFRYLFRALSTQLNCPEFTKFGTKWISIRDVRDSLLRKRIAVAAMRPG